MFRSRTYDGNRQPRGVRPLTLKKSAQKIVRLRDSVARKGALPAKLRRNSKAGKKALPWQKRTADCQRRKQTLVGQKGKDVAQRLREKRKIQRSRIGRQFEDPVTPRRE